MSKLQLFHGCCLDKLPAIPDQSVDSVVTDPPYELGFMGKKWDSSGIAYNVQVWRECLRVLKPGGHLLAFGGSRTYHRLACAIEDAGFEIRDCIMWVYGSGFPKSLDVSKAIDKRRAGNDVIRPWLRSLGSREEIARAADVTPRQVDHWLGENTPCPQTLTEDRFIRLCRHFGTVPEWANEMYASVGERIGEVKHARSGGDDFAKQVGSVATPRTVDVTAPATPEAARWQGWGTALKPAYEPVVVARKPLIGTVAENVLAHGTGGINIDACRIGRAEGDISGWSQSGSKESENGSMSGKNYARDPKPDAAGRWPANLIHDGSEEVVELFPGTNGSSASRFFYTAKTPKSERQGSKHPTIKPLSLIRYLCRLVTPPGGTVLDPFLGSGTTAVAALLEGLSAIGIEKEEEYLRDARSRVKRRDSLDK